MNPHCVATSSCQQQHGPHFNMHDLSQTTGGGHLESHFASVNKNGTINHSVIIAQSLPGSHSSFVMGPAEKPKSISGYDQADINKTTLNDAKDRTKVTDDYHHRKSIQSQILQNAVNYALQKNSLNCSQNSASQRTSVCGGANEALDHS